MFDKKDSCRRHNDGYMDAIDGKHTFGRGGVADYEEQRKIAGDYKKGSLTASYHYGVAAGLKHLLLKSHQDFGHFSHKKGGKSK